MGYQLNDKVKVVFASILLDQAKSLVWQTKHQVLSLEPYYLPQRNLIQNLGLPVPSYTIFLGLLQQVLNLN